ncbi:MAG: hypothetical protein E7327_03745 [Clostridiales bacterium]|nr:hypothetical protein [Clostridiales bacterium]
MSKPPLQNAFRHATHAALLTLALAAVWLAVRSGALPDGTALLISGVLFGLSGLVALAAVFLTPELPRLPRELGRTPAYYELWAVLLFYLCNVFLLAMDYVYLTDGQPVRWAGAGGVLSVFAACLAVANQRMCICWNAGGFVLRTALGNTHRFSWSDLTGHSTYKGTLYLRAAGRSYVVNLGVSQIPRFLYSARSPH